MRSPHLHSMGELRAGAIAYQDNNHPPTSHPPRWYYASSGWGACSVTFSQFLNYFDAGHFRGNHVDDQPARGRLHQYPRRPITTATWRKKATRPSADIRTAGCARSSVHGRTNSCSSSPNRQKTSSHIELVAVPLMIMVQSGAAASDRGGRHGEGRELR